MHRSLVLYSFLLALFSIVAASPAVGDCTMIIGSIVPKEDAWVTVSGTAGGRRLWGYDNQNVVGGYQPQRRRGGVSEQRVLQCQR